MTTNPQEDPLLSDDATAADVDPEAFVERISEEQFETWYRRKQWEENVENGQPYFNGPGSVPDPERHSPSSLLQCHRKIWYRQQNAPEEQSDPRGIFWFGSAFEEELVLPFLQEAVARDDAFATNSLWVDFTESTAAGELRIKGSTDPVIVDANGAPILPTEIKTKEAVDSLDEPNAHHLAQLHAYLVGLSEKYDREITDGVLVYGSRKHLDVRVFHVEFDRDFWEETVLEWASDHSLFRLEDALPPAEPEYGWECQFCEYRNRCGEGETSHADWDHRGLLPEYEGYPRQKVIEYLEGHDEETLTPMLAEVYPDLAEIYDVAEWYCPRCESTIPGQQLPTDGEPVCPECAARDELSTLVRSPERGQAENGGVADDR